MFLERSETIGTPPVPVRILPCGATQSVLTSTGSTHWQGSTSSISRIQREISEHGVRYLHTVWRAPFLCFSFTQLTQLSKAVRVAGRYVLTDPARGHLGSTLALSRAHSLAHNCVRENGAGICISGPVLLPVRLAVRKLEAHYTLKDRTLKI